VPVPVMNRNLAVQHRRDSSRSKLNASVTSAERAEFRSGTGLAVAKMSAAASPRSAAAEEYRNGTALLLVVTGTSPTVPLETVEM
jgi:hypothetical protein